MEYLKHNFKPKETLTAQAMNELDEGIALAVNPSQEVIEVTPIYNSTTKKTTSTIILDPQDIHGKTFYINCGANDTVNLSWERFEQEQVRLKAGTKFNVVMSFYIYGQRDSVNVGQRIATLSGFDTSINWYNESNDDYYTCHVIPGIFLDPYHVFQTNEIYGNSIYSIYCPKEYAFNDDHFLIVCTFEAITDTQCLVTPQVRHGHSV